MNWYDFADPDDIRANELYVRLIDAKASGRDWLETWVKVPRKAVHHVSTVGTGDEPDLLWNGFKWLKVFTYEAKGRVYARLPQYGEVSE